MVLAVLAVISFNIASLQKNIMIVYGIRMEPKETATSKPIENDDVEKLETLAKLKEDYEREKIKFAFLEIAKQQTAIAIYNKLIEENEN